MKTDIALFGEIMLRLTPSSPKVRLVNCKQLDMSFAGAESNVAISLALLDNATAMVTKLPDHSMGDACVSLLKGYGINTEHILRGGARIGTYYIEQGSSIRPSKVVYDRVHSAFSQMSPEEFDWSSILTDCKWLYVGGIAPALADNCQSQTIQAVETAKRMGVKVAFDMNFRRSLWSDRNLARERFEAILAHTDLLFGNAGVLYDVFDWHTSAPLDQRTEELAMRAKEHFSIPLIGFTKREQISASRNIVSAIFLDDKGVHRGPQFDLVVEDRLGTGDAYAAGILHGLLQDWSSRQIVDFGTSAFALKHTIPGDHNLVSEKEILSIMQGNTKGHIER